MRWLGWLALTVCLCAQVQGAEKLRIVTTFLPGFNVAKNVAGDLATVENLVPGNVSLHDYQLSPGELRKLNGADLVLLNGLGLETFLDRAMKSGGAGLKAKLVVMTDGLHRELIHGEATHRREEAGHDHAHDPHVWLDPTLMAHAVTNAMRALQKADPANADTYAKNAAAYAAKLRALDAELKEKLAAVKEVPLVDHDAVHVLPDRVTRSHSGPVCVPRAVNAWPWAVVPFMAARWRFSLPLR